LPVAPGGGRVIVGEPRQAPLGNNTKLRGTPSQEASEAQQFEQMSRSRAYQLKARAAELLPNERVRICMNHRVKTSELVNLNIVGAVGEPGRAYFTNLMVCKSVWICPVCARAEAEERRIELQAAIDVWHMAGGTTLHLVHTLQHHRYESCEVVVDGLQDAVRRFWDGRPMRSLVTEFGIGGRVYVVEGTYGAINGWHPHRHTVLFINGSLTEAQIGDMENRMSAYWGEVVGRIGRYASLEHGLMIVHHDNDAEYLADYFNKFGHPPTDPELAKRWTAANELTKGHLKLTRRAESFTPMDLLAIYDQLADFEEIEGDGESEKEEVGRLYQEYAAAFKGRKQLVWSRGLRERIATLKAELGIESEPKPEPKPTWTAVQFPEQPLIEVRKRQLQPILLNLAEIGGDVAIKAFLEGEGIRGVYYPRLDIKAELVPLADGEGVTVDLYEYVWGEVRGGDLAGDDLAGDQAGPLADVYQKCIF